MNRGLAARCLAELGNLTRLDIYRLLVRAGPAGLNITEIQTRLTIPASTLAFHLRGLVGAGLVLQEKIGRVVICRAKYRQLDAVIEFLREECCKGFDEEQPATTTRRAS
jgi:ArsR family transcriptional regulator, arsenate/arsenite/antimonite-responsive transcriptional repressor